MNIQRFASLISYITMLANRGGGCLSVGDIDEVNRFVQDLMPAEAQKGVALPEEVNELLDAMNGKCKIDAIKAYRALTNVGLKEAKDFVEKYGC